MFWRRSDERTEARNTRLFREAVRRIELEIKAIVARNAAKGILQSGATIKEIVRALDEAAVIALTAALDGIASVTKHNGSKRKRLLEKLQSSLGEHHAQARGIAQQKIEAIGLGGDFRHAVPLIAQAEGRHREKIQDFGEGWTAPSAKPWHERHPIVLAIIVAIVSAVVGASVTAMMGSGSP